MPEQYAYGAWDIGGVECPLQAHGLVTEKNFVDRVSKKFDAEAGGPPGGVVSRREAIEAMEAVAERGDIGKEARKVAEACVGEMKAEL